MFIFNAYILFLFQGVLLRGKSATLYSILYLSLIDSYFTLFMLLGLSNTLLFLACHFRETCVFFVPITIITVIVQFRVISAIQRVVSVDVASHCREKREKEREKGGQVSAQCSSFKILSWHIHESIMGTEFKS